MSLQAQQVALEAIAALRPLMPLIRRSDHSRALRPASCSSLAEGSCSDPGNRRASYFSAAGPARDEARAALRVAVTWGYFAAERAEPAEALLDRVVAMVRRLTHGRGRAG